MFNYLRPAGTAERDWAGLTLDDFNDVRHRVVFELELDVVEHPDGRVTGAFSVRAWTNWSTAGFVEALTADYHECVVQQFVDAPHEALGASPAHFAHFANALLPIAADVNAPGALHDEATQHAEALERV